MKPIEEYLDWLEKGRGCMISTRNVGLAAIHDFFRYLQLKCPDYIYKSQKILSVQLKRTKKNTIGYLSLNAIKF